MKFIKLMNTHNPQKGLGLRCFLKLFLNYMLKPYNCITNYDD